MANDNTAKKNNRPHASTRQHTGGYQNRPLAGRFAELRDRIHTRPSVLRNAPAVNSLGDDGVDHINVFHLGKTELGKALSFTGDLQFTHNRFGKFRNVAGLMAYLSSKAQPDNFRTMPGSQVFAAKRRYDSDARVYNYRWVAADATWQKITQNPATAKALYECDLPFDIYRMETTDVDANTQIRVRLVGEYEWLVPALDEMRRALRDGREPNLSFLQSEQDTRAEKKETEERLKSQTLNRTLSSLESKFKLKVLPLSNVSDVYFARVNPAYTTPELSKWLKSTEMQDSLRNHPVGTPTEKEQAFLDQALQYRSHRVTHLGYLFGIQNGSEVTSRTLYEVRYGRRGGPSGVMIFARPTSDEIGVVRTVLAKRECRGLDSYGTFILMGGTLSATVLLQPESVECGAEPPLFSEDKIIDELKQYNFERLKDGTAQYRAVKVVQDSDANIDSAIFNHASIDFSIQEHSDRYHTKLKFLIKHVIGCKPLAYIIDTYSLINDRFVAYKLLELELEGNEAEGVEPSKIIALSPFFSSKFERAVERRNAASAGVQTETADEVASEAETPQQPEVEQPIVETQEVEPELIPLAEGQPGEGVDKIE